MGKNNEKEDVKTWLVKNTDWVLISSAIKDSFDSIRDDIPYCDECEGISMQLWEEKATSYKIRCTDCETIQKFEIQASDGTFKEALSRYFKLYELYLSNPHSELGKYLSTQFAIYNLSKIRKGQPSISAITFMANWALPYDKTIDK